MRLSNLELTVHRHVPTNQWRLTTYVEGTHAAGFSLLKRSEKPCLVIPDSEHLDYRNIPRFQTLASVSYNSSLQCGNKTQFSSMPNIQATAGELFIIVHCYYYSA